MALFAHKCTAQLQMPVGCTYKACFYRYRVMAQLHVLWRHSRKHTDMAAEHDKVRAPLAELHKRCLLCVGISYILLGTSSIENRLEQELQLYLFLMTLRVTHDVLCPCFLLESKRECNVS